MAYMTQEWPQMTPPQRSPPARRSGLPATSASAGCPRPSDDRSRNGSLRTANYCGSDIPSKAIVSYTPCIAQHYVGNHFGLFIALSDAPNSIKQMPQRVFSKDVLGVHVPSQGAGDPYFSLGSLLCKVQAGCSCSSALLGPANSSLE